jgi:hypothetical protein
MRDSMTGKIHPTLIDGTMPEKIEKNFIIVANWLTSFRNRLGSIH